MAERTGLRQAGRFYTLVGATETIAKLERLMAECPRALAALVRSCTEDAARQARALAPRRTGALAQHIFTKYFDEQTTGTVFVSNQIRDYQMYTRARHVTLTAGEKTGFRARKFPIWLEFGTRRADPRPFLIPAGAAGWARMQAEAPALVERFVREAE